MKNARFTSITIRVGSTTKLCRPDPATLPYTGFGTVWFDYDNDGWLDIVMANGEVKSVPEPVRAKHPYPLGQANLLFRNLRNGRLEDVSGRGGPVFSLAEVSRGV